MTETSFNLFTKSSPGESRDEPADWDEVTLESLIDRVPPDVRWLDVRLSYAGCGSHDVLVDWGPKLIPEPEPDPPPAPAHPKDALEPLPPAETVPLPTQFVGPGPESSTLGDPGYTGRVHQRPGY